MTDDSCILLPQPLSQRFAPENADVLDAGKQPVGNKVAVFLAQALAASPGGSAGVEEALVPWIRDALLSIHSVKAYGRDLVDFVRHMKAQGVELLDVRADHVKLY